MKVFSVLITIYATAYVKADTEEQALERANELKDWSLEITEQGNAMFSGLAFSDPALPTISLSPAVTIADVEDDAFVEEVEE